MTDGRAPFLFGGGCATTASTKQFVCTAAVRLAGWFMIHTGLFNELQQVPLVNVN